MHALFQGTRFPPSQLPKVTNSVLKCPTDPGSRENWEDVERKATEGEQGSKESSQQWLRSRGRTRWKTLLQILTPHTQPFLPVSILKENPSSSQRKRAHVVIPQRAEAEEQSPRDPKACSWSPLSPKTHTPFFRCAVRNFLFNALLWIPTLPLPGTIKTKKKHPDPRLMTLVVSSRSCVLGEQHFHSHPSLWSFGSWSSSPEPQQQGKRCGRAAQPPTRHNQTQGHLFRSPGLAAAIVRISPACTIHAFSKALWFDAMNMPDTHKIYELKSQISIQVKKPPFYISLEAVKLQM